jgi:outer membrane receptor protein involved in Fe transport
MAGVPLVFDPSIAQNKRTSGLNGEYGVAEGFRKLLAGTGLEIVTNAKNEYSLRKIVQVQSDKDPEIDLQLKETVVKARRFKDIGPLPGLNLTKEQIPGNIQSISAQEIKESRALSLSDLLNSKLQSVNVNDYQGNPFQMDITYRGFTAGPQIGTPQGLSVFLDGIRVNEPFGDVVNWDMIPMNALSTFDVFPGSNPLFGLNTLGGALSMRTKSGFDSPGVSVDVLAGSYGRKQLQASGGWNNGSIAAFGAANLFMEDGWRDNSPSEVNQVFGKLEWQGEQASLGFSALAVVNKLVGNGTVPQELYRENAAAVFTSPDETRNRLMQYQISGAFDFNDRINVTGQVYHRDSTRKSRTGDIIDLETFRNDDHSYVMPGTRLPGTGSGLNCGYTDANSDGIPDYFKVSDAKWLPFLISTSSGTPDYGLGEINGDLNSVELDGALKKLFEKQLYDVFINEAQYTDSGNLYEGVTAQGGFMSFGVGTGYIDDDGDGYRVFALRAKNIDTCVHEDGYATSPNVHWEQGMVPDVNSPIKSRDGAIIGYGGTGVVEGTPTAIITNSNIEQSGQGASLQINFNFDKHKLMIGRSIDIAQASYVGKQRLGLLDDSRNVYSDPSKLGEEFYAGSHDLPINDFDGKSSTRSVYFSETWSPTETLNLSVSARYNASKVKNKLAPSVKDSRLQNLHLINRYVFGVVCPGTDLSNCPYSLDAPIPADEYWDKLVIVGHRTTLLDKPATEKFSYHNLNPALGATWQAKPNLNLYANWNQGTRVPSVIELGCAYDDTLIQWGSQILPRSIADGRGCKLPSALSGDPYLPQVVAQTYEIGARGKFKDFLEWNVSAYRTNVKDDIYMVSVTNELNFFQDVGATRRQGIEFGLAGEYGKSDFRMNYSLTEATFQSFFKMASPNNSSRTVGMFTADENMIQVQPGNVMPGVPFNNVNFNWGYKLTPSLKFDLGVVAHSSSFLRGNENNAHTPSPGQQYLTKINGQDVLLKTADNEYSGKAPGYAVVNLRARYDLGKGWAAGLMVNNLLDKKYYTAGRLGLNPFAPSTIGAIGPGGFNYNSSEWLSSQFISAGAPRGAWATISYDFDASRKYDPPPSNVSMSEPDRTLDEPDSLPNAQELALMAQLQGIKSVPVLSMTTTRQSIKTSEQEIKTRIEEWRKAQAENNAATYLQSYIENFSPPGMSHNQWAEQHKLQFIGDAAALLEINELVVAPQGGRMVAVFNQKLTRGDHPQTARKILSFEQRDGQWQIARESALPISPLTFQAAAPVETKTAKVASKDSVRKPLELAIEQTGNSPVYAEVQ